MNRNDMTMSFIQKLGFFPKKLIDIWKSKNNWIWFHAVSVGELNAVWPLILEINKIKPAYPIMISTTTSAGYKLATELCNKKGFLVFYFPFDIPFAVKSFLSYVKIKLFIIVETEIWPFVMSECKRHNIPILLVNARLSDKSFKNYMLFKFFFKNIINLFSKVLSQSESDTKKFLELGLNKEKIKTTGNIKFISHKSSFDIAHNHESIANGNHNIKIIFASTHSGEEEIAVNVFKELQKELDNINLLIAPRHITRVSDICNLIRQNGFNPVLKSRSEKLKSQNDVFVLDTIGELSNLYNICDITVLGGTFVKIGGHNVIEPISANSYTIIGPYDYKISELSNIFKRDDAITQVKDTEELRDKIKEAVCHKEIRETKIRNGIKIIKQYENVLEQLTREIMVYL